MIILDATNRSIEVKLSGAVAATQPKFIACWVDHTSATYTPGTTTGATNNTTAVTAVAAPGASTQRSLKFLNVLNMDSTDVILTVQFNDNTTLRQLIVVTLDPNDTLQYVDTEGWSVLNTNGQKKSIVEASAGTNLNTSALALEATLTNKLDESAFTSRTGAVTESAPASDTASSGLNGRLQRVAQRLTSLIALLPTALVSNRLDVNLGAAPATVTITGLVAHDAVDSGNPVKLGMKTIPYGASPTAVAEADRTDWYANRHGIPFILGGHPNIITEEIGAYAAAQTDLAMVTIATGLKIVVTQIQIVSSKDVTVNVAFRIGFGAAVTPTTTKVLLSHPGLAPGEFLSRGDGSGVIGVGADGADLRITSSAATTGSIRIIASYFLIET